MLIACIVLASVGFLVVGYGGFLTIRGQGRSRPLTGEEIGEDIVRRQTRDSPGENPLAEAATFRGVGGGKAVEASVSFSQIKADWRAGRRDRALPPVLVLVGLAMLLVFGSLALLVGLESKVVGAVLLAVVLLTLGRQIVALVRA